MFGQASNILKRQGGYLFIDGIRILSWIDEPQMIEFQNLRSSMRANLFTMKIRNVNPKFQHNHYEPGCCYQEWKTSGGLAVCARRRRIGAAITCLSTPFAKDSFGRPKSDSIHWRHLTQGILEGNGKESIWSTRSHRLVKSIDRHRYCTLVWMPSPIPHRLQRLRSRLMVLEGLKWFALKKCIRLESFQSTKVFIF